MKKILFYPVLLLLIVSCADTQSVRLNFDTASMQQQYATKKLSESLLKNGYSIVENNAAVTVEFKLDTTLGKEAYIINNQGKHIVLTGGNETGLIYAANSMVEDLKNGIKLNAVENRSESPQLMFRAIKFDLPWDSYRHSYALSQHDKICRDLNYWEAFLDMMSENRFNVLTVWNLHPYPFMIKPKNFPEASEWTDEEMKEWKHLFSSIFKMAKERGIDTYVMPFNIFVPPSFAKKHGVALNNLEHHHYVDADTSQIIKTYTRESVTQLLNEYPDLSGMGLTLGEGMGGMTPFEREQWMQETIIAGMQKANRTSKLIHRIPFSGNTESLGATSMEMEQITRDGIEKEAAMENIEKPVWASMKFNWSHPHSTTKLIKVHGGKLYGKYFDPVPKDFKIVWTVRNEDFFCLRWGVEEFARAHIKANTPDYVGGYFIGSETYIPAKDYFTNPDYKISAKYAFERQWLFYKLWGRLLYNADTPNTVFINEFKQRYGEAHAEKLFKASNLAGKTPLRLVSFFDSTWDFTMYAEGFTYRNPETENVEFIDINRFINQPPQDTTFVSIANYVKNYASKQQALPEGYTTPVMLANNLERDSKEALRLVENIAEDNTDLMYEVADIKTWAYMGLYMSEKIKGGIALETHRQNKDSKNKELAVTHLKNALSHWDNIIEITRPIYNDMPLVHYSENNGKTWQENDNLRFHWTLLRKDVLKDIDVAKQ
ncbi:MAG: glycoside hydrolase family 20 zincin-like fold domain-containing protein [Flavobacteriales bacterium]